jgi:hypothetical protein
MRLRPRRPPGVLGDPSPLELPPLAVAAHAAFVLRASSLDPDAEPFAASPGGLEARLHFSDSEASFSNSDAPPPPGRGKAVYSRRPRRGDFMGDARHSPRPSPPAQRRLASIMVPPPRMSVQPDAEGFRPVQSCRCWRCVAALRRPVPSNLLGKCFNYLAGDHVKAYCTFPSKCFNCKDGGHQARDCPLPPAVGPWEGKRGRSPGRVPSRQRGARRCRSSPSCGSSADTASARSVSTGIASSVPPVRQPPTPEPFVTEPVEPTVDAPTEAARSVAGVSSGVGLVINIGAAIGDARGGLSSSNRTSGLMATPVPCYGVSRNPQLRQGQGPGALCSSWWLCRAPRPSRLLRMHCL